ncbi:MAG: PASTA domain-containing protein [Muribaculaceae bacterium]|nr:PASTA domain-containing protein [Muribaculaceae bacterium]
MPTNNPRRASAAPPRRNRKKKKLNNRQHIMARYAVIVVAFLLGAGAVIAKLSYTTIIEAPAWNTRAAKEMQKTVPLAPERGNILAANGNILACNQTLYDVRLDMRHPRLVGSRLDAEKWRMLDSLADSLDTHYPRNKYIRENADSMARYSWHTLFRNEFAKPQNERRKTAKIGLKLTKEEWERIRQWPFFGSIKAKGRGCPVYAEDHVVRIYTFGDMARLSIGRVYEDSATRRITGYAGLEKALDSLLYGKPGRAKKVAMNNGFANWVDVPPVRGYDILSTIDIDIQDILEEELLNMCDSVRADWGTAIVMEVATGEIKAISNVERNPETGRYEEAMNRALQPFEPGSVMKPIALMVAFEDGLVRHNTDTEDCSPFMRTSDHAGGGRKTMRQIIATSSNTGIARVIFRGYREHPEKYRDRLASIGFFERMNSGIGGEQLPRVPILYATHPKTGAPITMTARHLDLARQAYGYNTEIPPLYTLSYYNAIANKGRYVRPHIVRALRDGEGHDSILPVSYIRDPLCSEKTAQQVKECLYDVVWDKRGTARALQDDRVTVCGKTGTAIPYDYEHTHAYDNSKRRFAFAGFFPYENPRYSCMVLMTAPAGSTSAARGSGKVLLNVALKLFARGLLTDPLPYSATDAPKAPHLYAAAKNYISNLVEKLGLKGARKFQAPEAGVTKGFVPDVRGLDLPAAIALLEKSGLNVSAVEGSGYVAASIPAPGTKIAKGSPVKLRLQWK